MTMTRQARSIAPAILPIVLVACASHGRSAPFQVAVQGPASSCAFEVDGRSITLDELPVIARAEAKSGRRARIDANTGQAPYQCIGGAVYALQAAGFKDVGFIAEPPALVK